MNNIQDSKDRFLMNERNLSTKLNFIHSNDCRLLCKYSHTLKCGIPHTNRFIQMYIYKNERNFEREKREKLMKKNEKHSGVNKRCAQCREECKQFKQVAIHCCPNYVKKSETKKKDV